MSNVPPAVIVLVLTVAAAGCKADDPAAPPAPPPFPDVAGTYTMTGSFERLANSGITGTLTLVQASRASEDLAGTVVLSVPAISAEPITGLTSASVTEAGAISFRVGTTASGTSWTFTGTAAGKAMVGQHVLIGTSGSVSGAWSAARP